MCREYGTTWAFDLSLPHHKQFTGQVLYFECRIYPSLPSPLIPNAYPNYANFGGLGKFNGVDGYFFDMKVFDHGEPGINLDRYEIKMYDPASILVCSANGYPNGLFGNCLADDSVTPDLVWVLDMGCLTGGKYQYYTPQ